MKSLSRVRLFVTPVDCSLPGSSVHGILQAIILKWVAISFSRGSSQLRDQTGSPTLEADALTSEPPGKPTKQQAVVCITAMSGKSNIHVAHSGEEGKGATSRESTPIASVGQKHWRHSEGRGGWGEWGE